MSNSNSSKIVELAVAAAFGAIGAIGLFVYQKMKEQKHREHLKQDLDKMATTMAELQEQLDNLRIQQNRHRNRGGPSRRRHMHKNNSVYSATDNDTDIDAFSTAVDEFSTADTDFEDNEEFFDFSDMESGDGDNGRISGPTNELDQKLSETDKLIESGTANGSEEALSILRTLLIEYPDNLDVIWRFTRACHKCSTDTSDSAKKLALISEGIKASERFESSDSANFHKWYAISIGAQTVFLPTKEKIKNGYRFRKHLDKALELSPKDAALYHLLGRFKYEVANLNWIERTVASTLFEEPPSATFEEAIEDFKYAEKLTENPYKDNRLFLGKCYIALGKYRDAVRWLKDTKNAPTLSKEDRIAQNEADELLSKYARYH